MLRSIIRSLLFGMALVGISGSAHAQDFSLDTALVATFEATDPDLRAAADRYAGLLEKALADQWMLFRMDDVPAFRDYDASVFVRSCPDGQYVSCVLVIADRVQADWVVGGQVRDIGDGLQQITLSFIDVKDSQLVLQYDVVSDGGADDLEVTAAVAPVFADVLAGVYDGKDVRAYAPEVDPEEQPPEEVEDLGSDDTKRGRKLRGRTRRITRSDVEQYDETDAEKPWTRTGLNKTSWMRWRNSGKSLHEWKAKARGRAGEILVGATAITVGQGPWTQVYEGWYALDDELNPAENATMQDLVRGIERSWDFSVGVGITPWLDVQVFAGPRLAPYNYRIQRVVEGQELRVAEPDRQVVSTLQVGGRVGFEPMPTFPARPTVHLGVVYWRGTQQDRVLESPSQLEVLPYPWMLLIQGGPGFEVDIGKLFYLWGRMYLDIPVAGRVAQEVSNAGPLLADRPRVQTRNDGIGISGSLGVTLRLRVPRKKDKRRL